LDLTTLFVYVAIGGVATIVVIFVASGVVGLLNRRRGTEDC